MLKKSLKLKQTNVWSQTMTNDKLSGGEGQKIAFKFNFTDE